MDVEALSYEQIVENPKLFVYLTDAQRRQWLDKYLTIMSTVEIFRFYQLVVQPMEQVFGEDVVLRFFDAAYPDIDGQIAALEKQVDIDEKDS